ncbi:MAG: hypothetical protein Q8P88_00705 [Candidatus Jorgensenbacteria bacterium]|nr:hypothetical protein [Candidatus Jorgensenbacteria bacterium]
MDRFKKVVDGIRKIEFTRKTMFYLLGIVMVVAIGVAIIGMATFLANRMNTALTVDPNVVPHVRFDTEGFEKLQLTK